MYSGNKNYFEVLVQIFVLDKKNYVNNVFYEMCACTYSRWHRNTFACIADMFLEGPTNLPSHQIPALSISGQGFEHGYALPAVWLSACRSGQKTSLLILMSTKLATCTLTPAYNEWSGWFVRLQATHWQKACKALGQAEGLSMRLVFTVITLTII